MNKKKLAMLLMALCLGCAGTASAAAVDYEQLNDMTMEELVALRAEVQSKIGELAAQDAANTGGLYFESSDASVTFSGFEMNDTNFKKNAGDEEYSTAIVLKFDYTNEQAEPKQVQQFFGITAYQNGVELDTAGSYSVTDTLPEAIDNYFTTVMDGGTVTVGRAFMIEDESPITIMVKSYDFSSETEPGKMILDFVNGPADAEAGEVSEAEDTAEEALDAVAEALTSAEEAAAEEAAEEAAEAPAADEATIADALLGDWLIYDDQGGENTFRFDDGMFTLYQGDIEMMNGVYEINMEESLVVTKIQATDGVVTMKTPFTYEDGTLQIYNNAGVALTKVGKVYTDEDTVMKVQEALNANGYDCGTPDGLAGSKTYDALNAYQEANGLTVTDNITDEVLEAMGLQ